MKLDVRRVDLPVPFVPTTPILSVSLIPTEILLRTGFDIYDFDTFSTFKIFIIIILSPISFFKTKTNITCQSLFVQIVCKRW